MSKNLIPEIAKMLGVDLGEEFKIKGYDGLTYKLTDNGLELTAVDGQKTKWFDHGALNSLLKGKMEIVKLPWKPKLDTKVYTFSFTTHEYNSQFCPHKGVWYVVQRIWSGYPEQIALLDKGWMFPTEEEAKSALPKVAKELGVEYEL